MRSAMVAQARRRRKARSARDGGWRDGCDEASPKSRRLDLCPDAAHRSPNARNRLGDAMFAASSQNSGMKRHSLPVAETAAQQMRPRAKPAGTTRRGRQGEKAPESNPAVGVCAPQGLLSHRASRRPPPLKSGARLCAALRCQVAHDTRGAEGPAAPTWDRHRRTNGTATTRVRARHRPRPREGFKRTTGQEGAMTKHYMQNAI